VAVGTSLGIESEDKASVLVPDVNCGENFRCALSACIYYPCMPKVSVDDVEAQLLALLEGETITMARGRGFGPQEPDEIYEENE
jgi:hypothetical protein